MTKSDLAVQFKHSGYNCAQAVVAAFAEDLGINLETARALGAGFGAGMGTMGATCGALCGAQIVLGLHKKGQRVMGTARSLYSAFLDRCGATVCMDLKGVATGRVICSCDDCVANAVQILEERGCKTRVWRCSASAASAAMWWRRWRVRASVRSI